jgi:hypothetical protein
VLHELGFAGQDVLVCMMDTGYRQGHQSFQTAINDGRLIAQWDFLHNDDNTDYDPSQDIPEQPSHGTYTWSALGGQASGNLYGPAYLADFCLAKTEDKVAENHSEEDNWAAGAQWADSLGAKVISASLGYRYRMDPPDEDYPYEWMNGDSSIVSIAADLAASRGITVATAQGNDGSLGGGSLIAPADCDSVIACGAVMDTDEITSFSGLGPTYDGRTKPEVCARGSATTCADPNDMYNYVTVGGTSLATPLVGGACAQLLQIHPNWTPMMVREALMMTATNTDDPDNQYGWGIIDVGKAMYYHPQGDIVIEHEPIVYFPPGLDNNVAYANISGGAGIDQNEVYIYWCTDEEASFNVDDMTCIADNLYSGIIPGLDDGYLQYYFSATDNDGVTAVYPYGAPDHFFEVNIGVTEFHDSFEHGLYNWKNNDTNTDDWTITAELANTGSISLTDSPYRSYKNNSEMILTSNFEIPLYGAISAGVSFTAHYMLQTNQDMVYFEVSDDGGDNWDMPGPMLNGIRPYFNEINIDLADYLDSSVKFRFRFVTNSVGEFDGVHIDDFNVVWELQTGIDDDNLSMPNEFNLSQNYPNPFNPRTAIQFNLAQSGFVELVVYDILGQEVKTLTTGELEAGSHQVIWDATNNSGGDVASGMYFYKLTAGNHAEIKRMVLLR